jgi:hypothetical protein
MGMGFGAAAVAGIGNAISDTVGEGVSGKIEDAFEKVGLGKEETAGALTEKQEKTVKKVASMVGIFSGCIAGMVPMLFGVSFGKSRRNEDDMEKSLTNDLDNWLEKAMVTKEGKRLKFKELEEKIKRQGGAADPGAVAAKVYREAGGKPSKRKVEKSEDDKRKDREGMIRQHIEMAQEHVQHAKKYDGNLDNIHRDAAKKHHRAATLLRENSPEGKSACDEANAFSRKIKKMSNGVGKAMRLTIKRSEKLEKACAPMKKDHPAANISKLADKVQGGMELDDAMKMLGDNDASKKNLLAELRSRKTEKSVTVEAEKVQKENAKVEIKKSRTVRINDVTMHLDADKVLAKSIEDGDVQIGAMARLGGQPSLKKGTIIQNEWVKPPEQKWNYGDDRETEMRQRCLAESAYFDPDGTHGEGGLVEWFRDSDTDDPHVNVPLGLIRRSERPTVVIDDSDPYIRRTHRMRTADGAANVNYAYNKDAKR